MTEVQGGRIEEIKQKVDELEKAGFTQEEITEINLLIDGLNEPELTEIITWLKEKRLPEQTAMQINKLKNSILVPTPAPTETPQTDGYGVDGLAEGNKSKFFDILLNEKQIETLKIALNQLSEKNLGMERFSLLGTNQKETLSLVMWNRIVSQIGLKTGVGFAFNKIGEGLSSVFSIFSGGDDNSEDTKEQDSERPKVEELQNIIEELKETPDPTRFESLLNELFSILTYITSGYYDNLKILLDVAKEKGVENEEAFQKVLENPVILNEILETGKYRKDGFIIDITDLKDIDFDLGGNNDIESAKVDFMEIVQDNTNTTGKAIDGLKGQTDKIVKFFTRFGLTSDDLRDLIKSLEEIPLIGKLLSLVLGFFVGDNVLEAMDKIGLRKKYKTSLSNFEKYAKKADNLPYKKAEYTDDDKDNLVKFLVKVEKQEQEENNGEVVNQSIISSENFWKQVFSKEQFEENSLIERVRRQVGSINPDNKDVSQKDYLEELAKIEIPKLQQANTPLSSSPETQQTSGQGEAINPAIVPVAAAEQALNSGSEIPPVIPETPALSEFSIDKISEIKSLPVIIDFGSDLGKHEVDIIDGKEIRIGNKVFGIGFTERVLSFYKDVKLNKIEFADGNITLTYNLKGKDDETNDTKKIDSQEIINILNTLIKNGEYKNENVIISQVRVIEVPSDKNSQEDNNPPTGETSGDGTSSDESAGTPESNSGDIPLAPVPETPALSEFSIDKISEVKSLPAMIDFGDGKVEKVYINSKQIIIGNKRFNVDFKDEGIIPRKYNPWSDGFNPLDATSPYFEFNNGQLVIKIYNESVSIEDFIYILEASNSISDVNGSIKISINNDISLTITRTK